MGQASSCGGCNPFLDKEEKDRMNMVKYREGDQTDRNKKKGIKMNTEPLIDKNDKNHKGNKGSLSIFEEDTDDGGSANSFISPKNDKTAPRLNSFTTTDPWDEDYESMDQDEVDMHQEMAQLSNFLSGQPIQSPDSNDGNPDLDQMRKSMKSHKRSLSDKINKLSSE